MKCFYHQEKDAVATCQQCGKAVCRDCVVTIDGNKQYCPDCLQLIIESQKKTLASIKWRLIFFGVFFVLGLILSAINGSYGALIACAIIGWLPIAYFYSKGAPDPYVPVSLEGAGQLAFFKLIVNAILGFIAVIRGIIDYNSFNKIIASNTEVYNDVISRR